MLMVLFAYRPSLSCNPNTSSRDCSMFPLNGLSMSRAHEWTSSSDLSLLSSRNWLIDRHKKKRRPSQEEEATHFIPLVSQSSYKKGTTGYSHDNLSLVLVSLHPHPDHRLWTSLSSSLHVFIFRLECLKEGVLRLSETSVFAEREREQEDPDEKKFCEEDRVTTNLLSLQSFYFIVVTKGSDHSVAWVSSSSVVSLNQPWISCVSKTLVQENDVIRKTSES